MLKEENMFGKKKKDMKKRNVEAGKEMDVENMEGRSRKTDCGHCCAGRGKSNSTKR